MVNLSDDTKERFDRLQPDECDTQDDFVSLLLDHYELTDDNGVADLRVILDRLDKQEERVGAKAELGAYRGVTDAIESTEIDP
jgi:hypothetical protein